MSDPFAAQRLDGKVLVVTGATQGLGAEIAGRAATLGAAGLVICGRDADRGAAVAANLEAVGCAVAFVRADLADADACVRVIAACDERFGRLDGLVNAAGLSTRGTLDDTSVELWDRLFAVNARAPFVLMQEAARIMRRERRGGSVVNIITMASHGGEPVLTGYSASKAALATLTRNAGYQLQPDRIRVNGLNIGWTATEGEHAVQTGVGRPEDWRAAADAGRPLGRLLRPDEDIAPMVTYLLSDAAQMITGSVMDFDQTVHGPYGEHVPAHSIREKVTA
jgi:NAD(P)-dependent dehydrogenase (short-subunit alcohol dehydrogenase family)